MVNLCNEWYGDEEEEQAHRGSEQEHPSLGSPQHRKLVDNGREETFHHGELRRGRGGEV